MKMPARIVIGFGILFTLISIVLAGHTTSAYFCSEITVSSYLGFLPLFLLQGVYLIIAVWFFRRISVLSATIALVVGLLFCLVAPALNGGGRCVPPDYRARMEIGVVQSGLAKRIKDTGAYPDTLVDVPALPSLPSSLDYQRTKDSYQLCANFNIPYFFGIKIGPGTRKCFGPYDTVR
jgi:hypothetical protein